MKEEYGGIRQGLGQDRQAVKNGHKLIKTKYTNKCYLLIKGTSWATSDVISRICTCACSLKS